MHFIAVLIYFLIDSCYFELANTMYHIILQRQSLPSVAVPFLHISILLHQNSHSQHFCLKLKSHHDVPCLNNSLACFNKTLHCHNSTLQDIQATQKSMLKLLEEKLTCHSGDSKLMNYSSREHHGVISASDKNAENENSGAVIWICVGMGLLQMAMTVFVK